MKRVSLPKWYKKKAVMMMASLSLLATALPVTTAPVSAAAGDYLLSQNRPTYASSVLGGGGANLAVDGDMSSRWESKFGADGQWIYVDLGASANISRILVKWEAAYAKSFRIEVSNDEYTWTPIHTDTNGTGGTTDVNVTGTGRYVRLYCTERVLPGYGISVHEFQVFGNGGINQPPKAPMPNVALNKPAFSSTIQDDAWYLQPKDYETKNVNDGDRSTRWSSLQTDPQWVYVDLGQSTQIGQVTLRWEGAYGRAYDIQVSNDAQNWTTVYRELHGKGGVNEIPLYANGRYVRMYGIARGTNNGYSLYEMEVFPYRAGDAQPTHAIPAIPQASTVNVGSGSYEINDITQLEALYPRNKTSNVQGPIPSNDWWQNLLVEHLGNSTGIVTLPLKNKYTINGLGIMNPGAGYINGDGGAVNADGESDLFLMANNMQNIPSIETKVDGYGDYSVNVILSDDNTAKMKSTFVKGSPYVYNTFADPNSPEIYSLGMTKLFDDNGNPVLTTNGSTYTADHIGIEVTNQDYAATPHTFVRNYGIFVPPGTVFTKAGNKIKIKLGGGQNYMSVASLPASTDLNYYYQHGYAFVTDTKVDYNYDMANAKITTTFNSVTTSKRSGFSNDTLLTMLPHQWKISNATTTSRSYPSVRGQLKVHEGNTFTTSDKFNGILPQFAEPNDSSYSRETLLSYMEVLDTELANTGGLMNQDPYWQGKVLHPAALGAIISDSIGDYARRDRYLATLRKVLVDWYTYTPEDVKHTYYMHYSPEWGSIFPWAAGWGINTGLTDHHYTYGYFVYASAVLAAYDTDFKNQYGGMVENLIRDYANPSRTDSMYPWLRAFDPYEGHSWAGAYADNNSGNNQEAAGESLNGYAGVYLWGVVTGNDTYRDVGAWIFTTELKSIEQYWFNYDQDNWIPEYKHGVAGQVWGSANVYGTYFSGAPVNIYGIHWLPTGEWMSYYGKDPQKAGDLYAAFLKDNGGPEVGWEHIVWPFQSLSDPQGVINKWNPSLLQQNEVFNAYWFIHNMNSYGHRTTDIWADNWSSVGMYKKGNQYTAQVWNPTSAPITVQFRNASGVTGSVTVGPHSLVKADPTKNIGGDTQAPSAPANVTAVTAGTAQINLSWNAATDNNGVSGYDIFRNGVKIGSSQTLSFVDKGLTPLTTYTYTVKAKDAAGNLSAASAAATAKTKGLQVALNRASWTATASTNSGDAPANMLDGSLTTRWNTGAAMEPGQNVIIDMKSVQTFNQIIIDANGSGDYARGYELYISNDGTNWGSAIASSTDTSPLITANFAAKNARYLKIVQTGTNPSWWSIHELTVLVEDGTTGGGTGPDPGTDPGTNPGTGTPELLDRAGWTATSDPSSGDAAANLLDGNLATRWSAGTAMAPGQSLTVDMKAAKSVSKLVMDSSGNANDYARGYEVYLSTDGTTWGNAVASGTGTGAVITATFTAQTARYIKVVQTGTVSNWWSIQELNVYGAGSGTGGNGGTGGVTPGVAQDRTGWTASSNPSSGDAAANLLDGSLATRWSAGTAMAPGQYLTVDMKASKSISKLVMDSTGSDNDYARGYEVYVSADGTNWGSAVASGTGSGPVITVNFTQQNARYIKVVQTGTNPSWWSIQELNVFS
ncbi:discoidin domain-containing protein [Paenibacillus sp. MMS18-CY102]|uniref:discoidin domain-containing protein n=1 Tax=Paenibacillus sp. MMS18-CY102 TaxID=2682849 RepID=UPI00136622B0|nr:discoidin domain-containing protein [Paenibacillus sp. MMS18-CY102]MWC29297.1 coagulation factor 5/8 type domain protein [Paenibacillus sp. MMS18-CY102]